MVTKKNRKIKKNRPSKKKVLTQNKKSKNTLVAKKIVKQKSPGLQVNLFIKGLVNYLHRLLSILTVSILTSVKNLIRAPFLFINIFFTALFSMISKLVYYFFTLLKKLFSNIYKFKEVFFGILFAIISGGIGAILAVSYLELNSETSKENLEISENQKIILKKIASIEENINDVVKNNNNNKLGIDSIKASQEDLLKTNNKFIGLEEELTNLNDIVKELEKQTFNIDSDLSILRKDLKSNSRLILSSSKTELSNRLYLAQSLLDRLESGVPYYPQLEALGKEGLDPALLRFANGGAPTLKDLEARLSARAGEQLDADRTKRDTSWKENLKKEISKYVKIKPTNINEIKGVTGALLRAEQSISRGNLAKAIEEISSVPYEERGPLDAWLTEATARQSADIAARNLLAKTTAALKQKN